MDGAELKAWREARGLTQAVAAKAQGISERAWQNYENGKRPIPADLEGALTGAVSVGAKARDLLEVASGAAPAPSAVGAGLRPYPRSNTQWGASINFDSREIKAPWQRVPGCCRVVSDKVPNPIPFYAPAWAGARGVPTADGRVFDHETGHAMRDYNARVVGPAPRGPMPGSRLKGANGKGPARPAA